MAVFEWTVRNIRRTPDGWPVDDDHILHIMIRRHGLDDQMADVFSTLSTYAGVPAFWKIFEHPESGDKLVLSFANVDGAWAVFDVARGLVFRDEQGDFADTAELAADPELVRVATGLLSQGDVDYVPYFQSGEDLRRVTPPVAPRPLRAELQMPWPRLRHEVTQRLTRRPRNGSE